jgi:hypothetical protein
LLALSIAAIHVCKSDHFIYIASLHDYHNMLSMSGLSASRSWKTRTGNLLIDLNELIYFNSSSNVRNAEQRQRR